MFITILFYGAPNFITINAKQFSNLNTRYVLILFVNIVKKNKNITRIQIAKLLCVDGNKIWRAVKQNGYKHFSYFKENFDKNNHKVISVEEISLCECKGEGLIPCEG